MAEYRLHDSEKGLIGPISLKTVTVDGRRTVTEIVDDLQGDQKRIAMAMLYLMWEIDAVRFEVPQCAPER